MSQMTDPADALALYQRSFSNNELPLRPCELDKNLFVCIDAPNGKRRFSYIYCEGRTITALAMLVDDKPVDGLPCFHAGVAVAEEYRGKGLAKKILSASIAELRHGLGRNGITSFAIEAIVSVNNHASMRVAEATISKTPKAVKDIPSGEPALQYVAKLQLPG